MYLALRLGKSSLDWSHATLIQQCMCARMFTCIRFVQEVVPPKVTIDR